MTEYQVRYVNRRGMSGDYTIVAHDIKHAMTQLNELVPHVRITSVLPAEMWTK